MGRGVNEGGGLSVGLRVWGRWLMWGGSCWWLIMLGGGWKNGEWR